MKILFPLLICLPLPALAVQSVLIEYRDKPPYSYTENGMPKGFLLERTEEIFRVAKVPVRYAEIPAKRLTADIQANRHPICSPGWYKLPEREAYARFSLAMHQDKPQVVLAGAHALMAIQGQKSLRALLADTRLTMGTVDGVSYGPELDKMIADMPRPAMRTTVAPLQLAKMVSARRADYMLIDQEDLRFLDQRREVTEIGLVRVDFPDSPQGLKRYLMCSQQLDQETMGRINAAIRIVAPGLNP
ncbi:substrate-binding periplasmic protein [Chitinimonas naiadis]